MMYPSTMFRVQRRGPGARRRRLEPLRPPDGRGRGRGRKFPRKAPIIRPQKNPVEWRANVTQLANADGGPVDGTNALQLSAAEVEGRRQIVDFFRFLRESAPGFENAYILEIAPQVGIRETRRLIGDYQLTGEDVLQCASFDDTIGVNGWPIEEHVAGNVVFRWPHIPQAAASTTCPTACCCRKAWTTCWWRAAAPR